MTALRRATAASADLISSSQRQMQYAVNHRQDALNERIIRNLPNLRALDPQIEWVSPLEQSGNRMLDERAFLASIGRLDLWPRLSTFWPRTPPVWSALAKVEYELGTGALMVIARSSIDEAYPDVTTATSDLSTDMVHEALQRTKRWAGAEPDMDWTGELYDTANHLVHLYFYRQIGSIPAWIVNLCFVDDPESPTTTSEWITGLSEMRRLLGLSRGGQPTPPDIATVLMLAEEFEGE